MINMRARVPIRFIECIPWKWAFHLYNLVPNLTNCFVKETTDKLFSIFRASCGANGHLGPNGPAVQGKHFTL